MGDKSTSSCIIIPKETCVARNAHHNNFYCYTLATRNIKSFGNHSTTILSDKLHGNRYTCEKIHMHTRVHSTQEVTQETQLQLAHT